MRGDALLFIGILVFLFIVWVAMGGTAHPLSFSGIVPPSATGVGTTSSFKLGASWGVSSSGHSSNANELAKAQQGVVDLQENYVSSQRFGTPSVYKGLVAIRHSVSPFLSEDPDKEYLTVTVSSRAPEAGVDISGWSVLGEAEGRSFTIPNGVNLPHLGNVNPAEPVVLAPGQSAVITIGDSPIGMSFRENMCSGYFDQFQEFSPPLQHACPAPMTDFNRSYLGDPKKLDACRAYIEDVRACTVPLDVPDGLGSDCNQFIDQYLNYNGCVDAHLGDRGFFGTTWRIYVGRNNDFFTKDHDTVKLLDNAGNTVDLLSY
ncbi:MAG TPA: hypothetical protein VHC20_00305 [Candidatus Paceibacterota bacterium]|nr:hypothetical protein [Candidatus Paceibacterota bacterium]